NTEQESPADAALVADQGFSISVDGEQVAGSKTAADEQRKADVELESVDIQIKYDGLDVKPILNVSTPDLRRSFLAGETVKFSASSNYPAWIEKSEVLIYDRTAAAGSGPVSVLPVDESGQAQWTMPESGAAEFDYVLRVYDSKNRFDETKPRTLARTASKTEPHKTNGDVIAAGVGEDFTATRNIPVYGGAVTVFGRNVPAGYTVSAIGRDVPVDAGASFVTQQILPPGDHSIDVAVRGGKEDGLAFQRQINIPSNDWFYVALADLTVGRKSGNGKLIAADSSEFDRVYTKGRLAFYLKGKIQGKYLLTAAADTGEDKVQNLFRGLDSKDPRQFLRRIDPDDFYPVYGDDSTSVEDAPTRGKFYVRLERGDSRVMWGNFKTSIHGAELLRNERALYGASAVYKSESATSFGERKAEVHAYAAQPETLPQRDVFLGTGGSVYFFKRQDLVQGTETVSIEVRDRISGRVISRRQLTAGVDYDIDPIQGIIILKRPLSSSAGGSGIVRDGALGDGVANLVVQYEYTPTAGQLDGYSFGGRAQGWAGEHLRFGATAMSEQTGAADQKLLGADITLRKSDTTYLRAEIAQSQGPGFGRTSSTDGGLTFNDTATSGRTDKIARAYLLRGQIDLAEMGSGSVKGNVGAHFEKKQAGFSTLDEDIVHDQTVWGLSAEIKPTDRTTVTAKYEDFKDSSGKSKRDAAADIELAMNSRWKAGIGVKHTALSTPLALPKENGSRTDVGAQVTYSPDEDRSLYVFGQVTAARSGGLERNDRIGVGGEAKLTEKIGVSGEVSYGTTGPGGLAALTYEPTADDQYYLGYRLDPDRTETGRPLNGYDGGVIVAGARRKYSDVLTGFAENNYDMFGRRRSLTSTYGVTYTPDAMWTAQGGFEFGSVIDPVDGNFDRKAISASVGYQDEENFSAKLRGEARLESSEDHLRDRQTYLTAATLGWKTNENWRFIANLDAVISNSDQSSVLDGDYVEASLAYAYRPVENDRLNMLLKYTFLYDLPGPQQVTVNGNILGPAQRSHIFSADASYDLNEYLTIGGKYGFRIGDVSASRLTEDFTPTSAHLAILRADLHIVHNWDALLEGRALISPSASTVDLGVLAAVYRHFGNNVKVGAGYNFGRFSDDLRDLTYDDQGPFINVVGTF
ncbi:MAG: TonB-dependent receptor, partial [Rhizobiaceae bacterium]